MTNARDKANIPVLNFQSKGIDDNADATAITIDSSERVGIGNTSPTGALDVKSGTQPQLKVATASATADRNSGFLVTLSNSATPGSRSAKLSLDADGGDGSGTDNLTITKTGGSGDATITNESNANIVFGTNNAERMRLNSTGLGIGNSNPSTSIHISSNTPILTFEETDQSNRQFQIGSFGNSYAINDATNSQFRYILDNSGNHVFNEGGVDCDFRVESNNNANMLFIDGGQDRIGIGESAPLGKFHITSLGSGATVSGDADDLIIENGTSGAASGISILSATNGYGNICFGDSGDNNIGVFQYDHNGNFMRFIVNASERLRIDSSGNVGIATTSIYNDSQHGKLAIAGKSGTAAGILIFQDTSNNEDGMIFADDGNLYIVADRDNTATSSSIIFRVDGSSEKMRIDSSGNVLVGTTSSDPAFGTTTGFEAQSAGQTHISCNGTGLIVNRTASSGTAIQLRQAGTTRGQIGIKDNNSIFLANDNCGMRFFNGGNNITPSDDAGAGRDNALNLGNGSLRWNDIYATNTSIQTSDENEKQSIQSLTTAEINVAKKLSSLIKTYKWNSSVEEKGDNARTHTGLIAQQVKQAFDDESLDASKYGFWCSDTWYVDAAGEEVTKDTEGAISKTRLGLRYSELFAFIQAYNDQRFTELEARITTLEANNP